MPARLRFREAPAQAVRADPLARSLFDLIKDADQATQILILNALTTRSAGRSLRGSVSLAALKACAGAIDRVPSKAAYGQWRAEQQPASQWPSATYVANSFGSWAKALEALGLGVTPDITARGLTATGSRFTRSEMLNALRAYAADQDAERVLIDDYKRWARTQLCASDRVLARVPASPGPFFREFGSWGAAVKAAGLEKSDAPKFRTGRRPNDLYNDEQLLAALHTWTQASPSSVLTLAEFQNWRSSQPAGSTPQAKTIIKRFGGWTGALRMAGLLSEAQAADVQRRRGTHGRTDEQILLFVQRAHNDLATERAGQALRQSQYEGWRTGRIVEAPPSLSLIRTRIGTWDTVLRNLKDATA